jgi:hypothetical protein
MNTPVNIAATVREANGDVGARADCVLYVDGAAADRADGIWVDAGGLVTCAFAYTFAAPGVKRLEVRAEGVTPADYEPANNSAAASLEITSDPFHYSAFARDLDLYYYTYSSTRTTRLSDGLASESQTSETKTGHEQASGIFADMPTHLTFPITRIEVSQTSGGTPLHEAAYDNVMPNSRGRCFQQQYAIFGYGKLFLCANPTSTVVQYVRWAGDVTYQSTAYSATWAGDGTAVGAPVYTWNGRTERDGLMPPLGGDVTIRLAISDDGALYNTVVAIPLQPYQYKVDWPLSCKEATNQARTTAFRTCTQVLWLDTGRAGSADAATP